MIQATNGNPSNHNESVSYMTISTKLIYMESIYDSQKSPDNHLLSISSDASGWS